MLEVSLMLIYMIGTLLFAVFFMIEEGADEKIENQKFNLNCWIIVFWPVFLLVKLISFSAILLARKIITKIKGKLNSKEKE